jgi:exodeoxyribonuclease V beta subunit
VRGPLPAGYERRRVACADAAPHAAVPAARPAGDLALPATLLESPREPADVADIRRTRRGFLVTSYSAVKRAREGLRPVEDAAGRQNPGEHHAAILRAPDALPGGAATGIFLHDLLERVALAELAARPDFPTWLGGREVSRLCERRRQAHGRPAPELEPAARLVHAAYTTPLAAGRLRIEGLANATTPLREMEFLYPMPEPGHALLAGAAAVSGERPWRIERGVVKGFVDLLFAHENRVYVLDWKSDLLPDYGAAALADHAERHYEVQARLYTLAALRLCGIGAREAFAARFGGVIFYFLRGRETGEPASGVHARTPDFDEVLAWEREMLAEPFWGLAR